MNKRLPLGLLSTDLHIKRETIEQIKNLIVQKCDLADQLGVDRLYCLGDIFESRKSQEQIVLSAFKEILRVIHKRKKHLYVVPGNHEKTDYDSLDSFLDPFEYHPSFTLLYTPQLVSQEKTLDIYSLPYLNIDKYKDELSLLKKNIDKTKKNLLLTHIGITGSTNNDGSKINSILKPKDFDVFDLVLIGHYHDHQCISDKIIHIPSISQNNFGEDPNKGFVVLYEDLSWEIVRSKFREFKEIEIHAKDLVKGKVESMLQDYDSTNMNIRLIVKGSREEFKSLKIDELKVRYGVDIQAECQEISASIQYIEEEKIGSFDKSMIFRFFQEFCIDRKFNHDVGFMYLNKCLSNES